MSANAHGLVTFENRFHAVSEENLPRLYFFPRGDKLAFTGVAFIVISCVRIFQSTATLNVNGQNNTHLISAHKGNS